MEKEEETQLQEEINRIETKLQWQLDEIDVLSGRNRQSRVVEIEQTLQVLDQKIEDFEKFC